jgi:Lon protease-like protein
MDIPLFPLPDLVLFPFVVLPLHIFEDRYKLMINSSIEKDETFGLICLRNDADQESEATIHRVGATARVIRVERLDDGRMNILCQGESRFRVRRFTQQVPYWKASVELFNDEDESESVLRPLRDEAGALYRKAFKLSARLGGSEGATGESELEMPDSPVELSYVLSYVLGLEPVEKQRLLEMTSTSERLKVLRTALDTTIEKLERQIVVKGMTEKARSNGDLGGPGRKVL